MPEAAGLYYETAGHAHAPPVLLSSGLGGSAGYWSPNVPAFGERLRVIAYDHRGTGRSDRTPLASLSVDDMADDMIALLDHLEIERAHVVGHALGGLAGMALALRYPERLARLVVVNGWAKLEPHTARCFDTRLALLRNVGIDAFLHAQPIFLYPANWLASHAERVDAEEEHQRTQFPGAAAMEQRVAAARGFHIVGRLDHITAPLLALSTEDDMLVPSIASAKLVDGLNREINGMHYPLQWGGHACNVTDPDSFNRVVPAWLADGVLPES